MFSSSRLKRRIHEVPHHGRQHRAPCLLPPTDHLLLGASCLLPKSGRLRGPSPRPLLTPHARRRLTVVALLAGRRGARGVRPRRLLLHGEGVASGGGSLLRARPCICLSLSPPHVTSCGAVHGQAPPPVQEAPPTISEVPPTKKPEKQAPGGGKKKKDEKHVQCLFQFKGHAGEMTCSRVSMTGKMVATCGEDRRILLWNISSIPPTQVCRCWPPGSYHIRCFCEET